eukprot:775574-Lingulodinium_polyedra.AAC.1
MEIPEEMSARFRLPAIKAHVLGLTELDGAAVDEGTFVTPCLTVLPMGWSWSLHYCQRVLSGVLEDILGADR